MLPEMNGTQTLSFDKYRYPIDPEQILPVQFKSERRRDSVERMCLACLESVGLSLERLREYANRHEREPMQLLTTPVRGVLGDYQLDVNWILGKDEPPLLREFSFEWVCDVLDLPVDRLRAAYLRRLETSWDTKPEKRIHDEVLLMALREHPYITIAELGRLTSEGWQKTWDTVQRLGAAGIVGMRKTQHGRKTYYVVGQ